MKARFFSAMLAAFMLATASVGGVTASAAEKTVAEEGTAETTAVDDDSSVETTETTTSEPADDSSVTTVTADDMEKFRDAENLWDGPQFPMDAIDVNGRVALTIACSGIDARVARDVHKYSESPLLDGKGSYIYSLAVNFLFNGIGTHWTITLDDVTTEGDWSLVSVCNGRYYGGGFMPVAEARMDDGVLNTLVVREVNRRTFLKFVGPYSRGEYAKFPEYAHCSCPKVVHIHSEKPDIVTCLDGESVVNSDVTIKLHDKKLNFFGPEGCSCNRTARG